MCVDNLRIFLCSWQLQMLCVVANRKKSYCNLIWNCLLQRISHFNSGCVHEIIFCLVDNFESLRDWRATLLSVPMVFMKIESDNEIFGKAVA